MKEPSSIGQAKPSPALFYMMEMFPNFDKAFRYVSPVSLPQLEKPYKKHPVLLLSPCHTIGPTSPPSHGLRQILPYLSLDTNCIVLLTKSPFYNSLKRFINQDLFNYSTSLTPSFENTTLASGSDFF
ncbi:hypothetical protein VNO80_12819 [Phaseolus coccineus]|uniref:Uncharacterized protein n=1 Tax=Phaseolus coccineus TaxID=3886 RepID=A0AAN9N5E6_PHACN